MADVTFRNESDGSAFQMTASKAPRVLEDIKVWATRNGFEHVVFWRDEGDAQKL